MNNSTRKTERRTRGLDAPTGVSHANFFDYGGKSLAVAPAGDGILKGLLRWTDTASDVRYEGQRSAA